MNAPTGLAKLLLPFAVTLALSGFARSAEERPPQSVFIEGDMVRGNTAKGQTGPTCVLNNQFKHNENAVFRVRVRDITGKPLDDKEIKGVVIELSDGQKLTMRYSGHPPRGSIDYFWAVGWVIPPTIRVAACITPSSPLTSRAEPRLGSRSAIHVRSWRSSPAACSIPVRGRRQSSAARLCPCELPAGQRRKRLVRAGIDDHRQARIHNRIVADEQRVDTPLALRIAGQAHDPITQGAHRRRAHR